MEIKFVDLHSAYLEQKEEIDSAVQKVLSDGNFILGSQVEEFEKEFAEYCGVKYAVGVDNGTNALELSLRVLGICEDDEVIIPTNTFIATALAVSAVGAKIVLCDVKEDTQLIDIEKIKAAITEKTKAIMPVHLFGQMVHSATVGHMAWQKNKFFIEDSSQAHGARCDNTMPGKFSIMSCYSLYPAKNLGGAGDCGIITTSSERTYKELINLRNYGSSVKYYHDEIGMNARLDTFQAAILSIKLKKLDEWNDRRIKAANLYTELLKDVGDIITPTTAPNNKHVFHTYVIRTKYRDKLQEYLKSKDVPTVIHYPIPIHRQKCYENEDFYNSDQFPITDMLSKEILSLPMHPHITEIQIEYIVDQIHEFFANSSHKSKGWFE